MLKRSLIVALAILCASCDAGKSADSGHELSQSASTLSDMGQPIPNNQQTRDWIGIADQLTDCSEIFFVEAEILNNGRQIEIAPGLDRTIEENKVQSGRLRALAVQVATLSGQSSEEYIGHVTQRGPQYVRYVADPSLFEREKSNVSAQLQNCQMLINSNPEISRVMNQLMSMPVQQFMN